MNEKSKENAEHWWFRPILAGATVHDRVLACLGALAGITLIGIVANLAGHGPSGETWILAPVGASAVLVFAVPASPLAQPWAVIGGSTISAAIGLAAFHLIAPEPLAAAVAVAVAIAAMTVARCLHPPGGAAALTAVLIGSASADPGPFFPVIPVGLDAVAIVLIGWSFHRVVTRHSYPHLPVAAAPTVASDLSPRHFQPEDVDAVLARIGDTFDISRQDLETILEAVEVEAEQRVSR